MGAQGAVAIKAEGGGGGASASVVTATAAAVAATVAFASGALVAFAAVRYNGYRRRRRQPPGGEGEGGGGGVVGKSRSDEYKDDHDEKSDIAVFPPDVPSPSSALALIQSRRSIFPKQYAVVAKSRDSGDDCGGANGGDAVPIPTTVPLQIPVPVPRYVLLDMLEAARWAPTHKLTEPWEFVVFETHQSRLRLGTFLANEYRRRINHATETSAFDDKGGVEVGDRKKVGFLQSKYDKKIQNALSSTFVVALCVKIDAKGEIKDGGNGGGGGGGGINPDVEEVCSLAMAVQNMHLMATAHKIGAYWSTGCIYDDDANVKHGGERSSSSNNNNSTGETSNDNHNTIKDKSENENENENKETLEVTVCGVRNPDSLREFLGWTGKTKRNDTCDDGVIYGGNTNHNNCNGNTRKLCLGWMFVGNYFVDGDNDPKKNERNRKAKVWPNGRRRSLEDSGRLVWR